MADAKTSALAALLVGSVAEGDLFMGVDVSDTSMAASGTNKKITAGAVAAFQNSETLVRWVPLINTGLLFSAETRDANGVVTSATIAWSRMIEGATDGVFTGTPNGTFDTLIELYTATFPDLSLTITVDFNLDANGQTSNPTIVVA